ncbi:MAG: diacylglycerol kinase family protein [Candidatus Omnitrophota bacterium]
MTRRKILRHIFKFHGIAESLQFAVKGIIYLFLFHRNMRIIFIFGAATFILGLCFHLEGIQLVCLSITITMVFMAEIFNTSIEMLMNMFTTKYRTRIKLIKDIAAAVVLLTCLNALVVGYALFVKKLFN